MLCVPGHTDDSRRMDSLAIYQCLFPVSDWYDLVSDDCRLSFGLSNVKRIG